MRKYRSLISIILAISLIATASLFGAVNAEDESKYIESFDFSAMLESEELSDSSDYYITAFIEMSYPSIDLVEISTLEKDARRARVCEYYKGRNEALAPESEVGRVSCSFVAPYIEIDYDSIDDYAEERDALIQYSKNSDIGAVRVSIEPANMVLEESETSSDSTTSDDEYTLEEVYSDIGITDRSTYSGQGIKVGILEKYLPNSNVNFPTNSVTTFGGPFTGPHPTEVMSMIGGTYGVSPDVSFYCATCGYSPSPNVDFTPFIDSLNWLMITQSVDIINMSMYLLTYDDYNCSPTSPIIEIDASTSSHYTNFCAYIDYAIATTGCLIVKSAGNWGSTAYANKNYYQMISKPGLSINALTVGSVDKDNILSDFSSFVEAEDDIYKPEVVAPGENIVIPNMGVDSGTSFSTPLVTGIAVKLMQEFPKLKTDPCLLKNAIMAGCTPCADQTEVFSDTTGFGRINYGSSRAYMLNAQYGATIVSDHLSSGSIVYHEKITLPENSTRKIKFNRAVLGGDTCTGYNGFTPEQGCTILEPNMIKYTISITDENGAAVYDSIEWNDTLKYLQVSNTTTASKNYEITIKTNERTNERNEYVSVVHGSNHVHCYDMSYSPSSAYYHTAICICGSSIHESHTFNSNSICTKCKLPEGFLGN